MTDHVRWADAPISVDACLVTVAAAMVGVVGEGARENNFRFLRTNDNFIPNPINPYGVTNSGQVVV